MGASRRRGWEAVRQDGVRRRPTVCQTRVRTETAGPGPRSGEERSMIRGHRHDATAGGRFGAVAAGTYVGWGCLCSGVTERLPALTPYPSPPQGCSDGHGRCVVAWHGGSAAGASVHRSPFHRNENGAELLFSAPTFQSARWCVSYPRVAFRKGRFQIVRCTDWQRDRSDRLWSAAGAPQGMVMFYGSRCAWIFRRLADCPLIRRSGRPATGVPAF